LSKSGLLTSLRRLFAKTEVSERNRDVSPVLNRIGMITEMLKVFAWLLAAADSAPARCCEPDQVYRRLEAVDAIRRD